MYDNSLQNSYIPNMENTNNGDKAHIDVTAYHEAGHAVAALRAGRQIHKVIVSKTQPGNGLTYHNPPLRNPFQLSTGDGNAMAALQYTYRTTCDEMRILLAGPLAEAKASGTHLRSLGSQSDLDKCFRMAFRLVHLRDYATPQ